MVHTFSQRLLKWRYDYFWWRTHVGVLQKVALVVAMACLTGLAAQVKLFLPFTPVPVTGQTFAVLLSGVLLGRRWGGLSQLFYLGVGVLGIPWFAGFSSGLSVIWGPTGGYMIGFVFAAFFLGSVTDRYVGARRLRNIFLLMLLANFVFIYVPGLLQLGLWVSFVQGASPSLHEFLWMGFYPFIPGAIFKSALAAVTATLITPKRPYGDEIDA